MAPVASILLCHGAAVLLVQAASLHKKVLQAGSLQKKVLLFHDIAVLWQHSSSN
jgi:hypothetical protein